MSPSDQSTSNDTSMIDPQLLSDPTGFHIEDLMTACTRLIHDEDVVRTSDPALLATQEARALIDASVAIRDANEDLPNDDLALTDMFQPEDVTPGASLDFVTRFSRFNIVKSDVFGRAYQKHRGQTEELQALFEGNASYQFGNSRDPPSPCTYTCSTADCGKVFFGHDALQQHQPGCTPEKAQAAVARKATSSTQCPEPGCKTICRQSKKSSLDQAVKAHFLAVHFEYNFTCNHPDCKASEEVHATQKALNTHYIKAHPNKPACPKCDFQAPDRSRLHRHLEVMHHVHDKTEAEALLPPRKTRDKYIAAPCRLGCTYKLARHSEHVDHLVLAAGRTPIYRNYPSLLAKQITS